LNTRIRTSKVKGQPDVKQFCHMLNGTLCATTRTLCCILENYQEEKGIRIPDCLLPFMMGIDFIPFVNKPPKMDKEEGKKEKK